MPPIETAIHIYQRHVQESPTKATIPTWPPPPATDFPQFCLVLPYACKKIKFWQFRRPSAPPPPNRIYSINPDLLNMTGLSECYCLWCVVRNCQRAAQQASCCIKCFTALHNLLVLCFIVFVSNWHFYGKYCVPRAETFTVSTVFRGLKHLR